MSGHPEELVELSEDLPGGYLGDKQFNGVWWNWQTQQTQNLPGETPWGFKSLHSDAGPSFNGKDTTLIKSQSGFDSQWADSHIIDGQKGKTQAVKISSIQI